MADNVWRLLLEAEDKILDTVEQDIKKLDEMVKKVEKIPALSIKSNFSEVVERDVRSLDKLRKKAAEPFAFDPIQSRASPLQDAAMARLFRPKSPMQPSELPGPNPWDRVLGRALPGGGLGSSIGAAFGGGMASTIGIGAAFAGFGALKSTITSAQDRDLGAKREMEAMTKLLEVSAGATSSMARLGNSIQTLGLIAQKVFGEIVGKISIGLTAVAGAAATLLSGGGLWKRMGAAGEDLLSNAYADQFLGGSGASDVVAAEGRLADAKKRRKDRPSTSGKGGSPEVVMGIAVDEMARRGLFVGSSSGMSMQQLQQDANRKLDRISDHLANLPTGLAERI